MSTTAMFNPPLPDSPHHPIHFQGLQGASVGFLINQLSTVSRGPLFVIAEDSLSAAHLIEQLSFFQGNDANILDFPDWETLPYDHFSAHQDIISDRLSTLYRLPSQQTGIILSAIPTLLHRLAPRTYLDTHTFILKTGDQLNIDILRSRLIQAGYYSVSQVREHGEFAIRGSIIDLYPMGCKLPLRIDMLDDEVESIREFSPETQLSLNKMDDINLLPAKEFPVTDNSIEHFRQAWRSHFTGNPLQCPLYQDMSDGICPPGIEYYLPLFFAQLSSIFDFLPKNTTIITIGDWEKKVNDCWLDIQHRYDQFRHQVTRPLLSPDTLFLSIDECRAKLASFPMITINRSDPSAITFDIDPIPALEINQKATQPLASLESYLSTHSDRILFCAETMGRREVLLQLLRSIHLHPALFTSWQAFLSSTDRYGIIVAAIEEGFRLRNEHIGLIPEAQLYNKRVMQRRRRKKSMLDPDLIIQDLTELQLNDPVVHIDHGIGRYRGLQTLMIGDQRGEYLALEYQNESKLYVPVSSLHLINRYTGIDPDQIPLSKLGTDQWQRTKRKAVEKIRDVAAELLDLYAKRAARPGHAYQLPDEAYAVFCSSFPFEETPDQLQAIQSVFTDMTSSRSMDRVVCGDVGFGKTEVAMRAAFLAVQNGKQVAILVPTTLLAQQHYQNFLDRFADWPIQIDMLSRFKTGKEQSNLLERMLAGKTDIVIGTHKLLQHDIHFKDLGLIIIDEEHRFGVKQKEKLKALRSMVDILTLTATPIPRTLNMALSGIRDLSLIATPPVRRLAVNTFVHEYNDSIIVEAIQREILRGGQVYFLHNEVASINRKADEIKKLVPEARTAVAHGQLHERDLERIMADFYHRHANVLICSTIIESGIDIPTANTIIINRADKFGLAQLHQLRGRVGRSHHQAYAYMLTPPRSMLSDDASKRLDAVAALHELGAGFTLATHDLEIRGAGELLGEDQSGNMHEIGFSLYMDLLSRAVSTLKEGGEIDNEKLLEHRHSELDLHLSALIPDDYLGDVQLRLQFYKRIASALDQDGLDQIQIEMIDRFGLLPDKLKLLFSIATLKQKADRLGIVKIDANEKQGKLEFSHQPRVKPETIINLLQDRSQRFRLDGPNRLRFTLPTHEPIERVQLVDDVLTMLS